MMPVSLSNAVFEYLSLFLLLAALGASAWLIRRYSEDEAFFEPVRERFVFGIPWGTLIVIIGVSLFYYLVQGGGKSGGPIIIGFRSWSLWYPQGWLFSSFSHASHSHLMGNLLATVAFAPIVEYAWGHYRPDEKTEATDDNHDNHDNHEAHTTSQEPNSAGRIQSLLDRPAGRIAAFVVGVLAVGIAGSLFVPGAVIGFSGVVFAFAGFAIVYRPLLAIVAIVGLQILRLFQRSFTDPISTATARPRFVSPSWADVALQGHLFGLLVGVLLAVALFRFREERPEILYVWFAALVFAVTRSMYAVYWYLGADQFVLYRAVGAALVVILACLVGLAAVYRPTATGRGQARERGRGQARERGTGQARGRGRGRRWARLPSLGTVAIGVLVAALTAVALFGLAYNVVSVDSGDDLGDGIEVGDYTVAYVAGAEDQYISAVPIPLFDQSVRVSGVVIASEDRNAWELSHSTRRLEFDGTVTIPVGDATWRESVTINRTTWEVLGGNATYTVFGSTGSGDRSLMYTAEPAVADLALNGTTISIRPVDGEYELVVERNGSTLGTERIPSHNESVTIADIEFERHADELYARHGRTVIQVAEFTLAGDR